MFNTKRIKALELEAAFSKPDIESLTRRLSTVEDVLKVLMDHLGIDVERVASRIQVKKTANDKTSP